MAVTMYYENDVKTPALAGKQISVIGYGSQSDKARAHGGAALHLPNGTYNHHRRPQTKCHPCCFSSFAWRLFPFRAARLSG